MIETLREILPTSVQQELRPVYQNVRRWIEAIDRAIDRRTLTETELAEFLQEVGITSGAMVMVHSSMKRIRRRLPGLDAVRFIHLLQDLLGENGTLLMPAFPFTGKQLDYVEQHPIFDPHLTPSRVGVLTEIFRQMPGVVRSLHPTHPIAAWGKHADELIWEHHFGTAFGTASPMYKMQFYNGLVVGLETTFKNSVSIKHVPEELHEKTRRLIYLPEPRIMLIRDRAKPFEYRLYPMRPDLNRRYGRVENTLRQEGILKNHSRKGLRCLTVPARELIERSMQLIEAGRFLF